jgi:hypothetical protein
MEISQAWPAHSSIWLAARAWQYGMYNDPRAGPAILEEPGHSYMAASWIGAVIAMVFAFAATIALSRRLQS